MPCLSAWTKHFCLGQNQICPRQNNFVQDRICFVQDKNFIHGLKIIFPLRKLISSHGQNFCTGQKCYGLDQFMLSWTNLILFWTKKNMFKLMCGALGYETNKRSYQMQPINTLDPQVSMWGLCSLVTPDSCLQLSLLISQTWRPFILY